MCVCATKNMEKDAETMSRGMKRVMSDAKDTTTGLERVRIVSVDGEWRGNNALSNGILSLGWVVGRADTMEVLEKRRVNFAPMILATATMLPNGDPDTERYYEQAYEQRCLDEFWSQHTDKKAVLERDPMDPMKAIAEFRAVLDRLEQECFKVVLISDAPGRDFHYINTYLDHAGLPPINTTTTNRYRQVYSTEDYARGAMGLDFDELHLKDAEIIAAFDVPVDQGAHDHMPENDAEYIYKLYFYTVKRAVERTKRRKREESSRIELNEIQ